MHCNLSPPLQWYIQLKEVGPVGYVGEGEEKGIAREWSSGGGGMEGRGGG